MEAGQRAEDKKCSIAYSFLFNIFTIFNICSQLLVSLSSGAEYRVACLESRVIRVSIHNITK